MNIDAGPRPSRRLAERCAQLLTLRLGEPPCSHNLLAAIRDSAHDGELGDEEAEVYLDSLEKKFPQKQLKDEEI